ncbi:MAG: hypothetical protein R2847_07090 [Bacteroidia bacterium]
MVVEGENFNYQFAADTIAAVHSGYALGVAFMHLDLIDRIRVLNSDGIYNIIITGHSPRVVHLPILLPVGLTISREKIFPLRIILKRMHLLRLWWATRFLLMSITDVIARLNVVLIL